MLSSVLDWCLAHPELIVSSALALLAMLKGKPWLDSHLADARTKKVLALAHVAFHAVEDASAAEPSLKGAAKLALFLDKLDSALEASGSAPLSDAEKGLAADAAAALNAQKGAAAANP